MLCTTDLLSKRSFPRHQFDKQKKIQSKHLSASLVTKQTSRNVCCTINRYTYRILLFGVRSNVLRKMITSHEFLVAFRTLKPFLAGVSSSMSLKFIRSRKSFVTKQPRANEWTFACNVNAK